MPGISLAVPLLPHIITILRSRSADKLGRASAFAYVAEWIGTPGLASCVLSDTGCYSLILLVVFLEQLDAIT